MTQFDSEQVRRIWQRVQSGSAPQTDTGTYRPAWEPACDFSLMLEKEAAIRGLYLRLLRYFSRQNGGILRQLVQQANGRIAALKGICRLCDHTRPAVKAPAPERISPEVLLRQCYGLATQLLAEYRRQSEHPQFGAVCAKMAEQAQTQCTILLSLLGSLK